MAGRMVLISLKHLLRPDLTPCAKLIAIGLEMDRHLAEWKLRSPSRLRRRLGPSRTTIRKALNALAKPGCAQVPDDLSDLVRTGVAVPEDLITDKTIPAHARVMYCILRGLYQLERYDTLSSYAKIAQVVHVQPRTVRRAVRVLAQAGWLDVFQSNKHAPVHLSFPDLIGDCREADSRLPERQPTSNGVTVEILVQS